MLSPYAPTENDLQDEAYVWAKRFHRFLEINQETMEIYGLIHSRFILSARGLALMYQKYISGQFGVCPRVLCEKQLVLPVGMSDEPRTSRVKVLSNMIRIGVLPEMWRGLCAQGQGGESRRILLWHLFPAYLLSCKGWEGNVLGLSWHGAIEGETTIRTQDVRLQVIQKGWIQVRGKGKWPQTRQWSSFSE